MTGVYPRFPPDWRCHEHGFIERSQPDDAYEERACPVVDVQGHRCGLPLYLAVAEANPAQEPDST
jgi:hypothetical protein